VLVFFIHHIALSIQAATILAQIREETIAALKQLFPQELGQSTATPGAAWPMPPADPDWTPVPACATGYIQSMDDQGLIDFSCK
jgi:uncharacterized membrane protein